VIVEVDRAETCKSSPRQHRNGLTTSGWVTTGYSLGSGGRGGLKYLSESKKITASALAKLSKAPSRSRILGAFVLPLLACAKNRVQNLDGLRHYTSGKPCLSSVFSSVSDPKPQ